MIYTEPIPDYGDFMTLDEFREQVRSGMFTDYDGFFKPARDGKTTKGPDWLYVSQLSMLPTDATHVIWFNK